VASDGARAGPFHGLIQHSFALKLAERRRPFRGRTNLERLTERFSLNDGEGRAFSVGPVGEPVADGASKAYVHSPLGKGKWTTVQSLEMEHLWCGEGLPFGRLPAGLEWATHDTDGYSQNYEEPRFIFADTFDDRRKATVADFFVDTPGSPHGARKISKTLLEVMAHKRSRLFGFALANRFVNVMLPYALLTPAHGVAEDQGWLLQPLVSFIRGGRDRTRLRDIYTLTLFLLPVRVENTQSGWGLTSLPSRRMSTSEIRQFTDPGWSVAASPPADALSGVSGPLLPYLSRLASFDLRGMAPLSGLEVPDTDHGTVFDSASLRQAVEKIGFGVGLSVAQGGQGPIDLETMRGVGNDVITSLGSARVSSVVVVDDELLAEEVNEPFKDKPFPGKLLPLMESLAKPLRMPPGSDPEARKYRLDRPLDDDDIYAIGVIPTRRCVVVASRKGAQYGSRESALMQAGSVAYMTLGAATAIGTLREIDKELEHLEGANPSKVAKIDREIAADLNEIYDLDITRESYRRMYRRLRDRLGITRDYETLQDEMNALHRATSTVHGDKAQRMLALLTAAIVVLSVLILIGTLMLIGKPGG
jgi:hypothetical protein